VAAVQGAFGRIGARPGIGSPRYAHELGLPGLRVWPLRRFPYLIFYVERADHLDVWRVLHAQRDLPGWMSGGV
jgi:toxin ParE1/3/4